MALSLFAAAVAAAADRSFSALMMDDFPTPANHDTFSTCYHYSIKLQGLKVKALSTTLPKPASYSDFMQAKHSLDTEQVLPDGPATTETLSFRTASSHSSPLPLAALTGIVR